MGGQRLMNSFGIEEKGSFDSGELTKALIERERAHRSLIDFAQFIDPTYEAYPVHRYTADRLEAIESGQIRRLALFVPPAIGKSRLASEIFPAWFFGRNPDKEFIEASYGKDLATGFGRATRNIIKDPRYQLVFPDCIIADDARAMDEWKTTLGGEYKAEGVGGGLIGFHAHVANIDDPFKNYEAALSLKERERVWNWYASVLLNRLRAYKNGPGAVILIMQRWHDDDLGGRVEKLAQLGEEEWEVVCFPSIAEENDLLGRKVGEALLNEGPNRRTLTELESIRAKSPSLFMALHQQKPISDEGDMFNPAWLKRYRPGDVPLDMALFGGSDFALTKGSGDYTVHMVVGVDENGWLWVIDFWRGQVEINEGIEQCVNLMLKHQPRKWFSEKAMMSKVIGPVLMKHKRERGAFTILESVPIIGKGSKDSMNRAGAIAGAMQMGYVYVPLDAPWVSELEYEMSRFPNGRFDDIVDTLSLFGMKLVDMGVGRGAAPAEKEEIDLAPIGYTFDELVAQNSMKRRGVRFKRGGIIIAEEGPSPLDDDVEVEDLEAPGYFGYVTV
jgi:predicted phage terminase large subunit-like protein